MVESVTEHRGWWDCHLSESAALGIHLCGVWFPCDVFLSSIKVKTSSPLCELRSIVNLTECGIFWEMELWACLWGGYHDCDIWDGNASPQREAPFHGSRTGWKDLSKPRTCVHCFFFQLWTQCDPLSGLCCSVTSLAWRTIIEDFKRNTLSPLRGFCQSYFYLSNRKPK